MWNEQHGFEQTGSQPFLLKNHLIKQIIFEPFHLQEMGKQKAPAQRAPSNLQLLSVPSTKN